ncbi:MAG TPA: hypothetical protein VMT03_27375 [Polyangia bacterium]|nr:hypothetical protein [Polyangia bacterium]
MSVEYVREQSFCASPAKAGEADEPRARRVGSGPLPDPLHAFAGRGGRRPGAKRIGARGLPILLAAALAAAAPRAQAQAQAQSQEQAHEQAQAQSQEQAQAQSQEQTSKGPPRPPVRQRSDAEVPQRPKKPTPPPEPDRPVVSVSGSRTHASTVQREPPNPGPTPLPPTEIEQIIRRSTDTVDFFELVDDMLDEVARQISLVDPNLLSPMAIRLVHLSANLRPEFARTLEARLTARLVQSTPVKVTVCAECESLRSRVENGAWVITLGAVKQEDLRRLGATVGIKTFMDLDFTYSADTGVIWMEATAFRASDGGVVWSDAYRSDGTMAVLLRTGQRIPSRAEKAAELEQKMAGRPNYGYAATLGLAQIGYAAPTGDVIAAQVSLRFHEKFGERQSNLFGISAGILTTGPPSTTKKPEALNSILLGAYYSHDLSKPNLNLPEIWVYGEAGGMFTGNEGNTFYVESGVDVHLKWRLSLIAGLMYILPTTYSGYDLGGLGFRIRVAMNW